VTPAATDDNGRPIVAELGRAETPEETAERKAAASAKRRSNQTAVNLVIALVASLGLVALLVLVVVRPNVSQLEPVDWAAVAAESGGSVDGVELIVPVLPPDWWANRAELSPGTADGVTTWEIGFITPSEKYIELSQGIDANPSWVAGKVANSPASGSQDIDGVTWQVYDRRDKDDPGLQAYALVTTVGDSTIVWSGDASDQEFATLAASVTAELDS
jgi:hypothetical protein